LRDLLINIVKRDGIEKKQAVNGVETLLTRRFDHCGFGTDNAVGSSNNFQEVNHNLLVRTWCAWATALHRTCSIIISINGLTNKFISG